ncbi:MULTISPECIES: CoA-acylating methylmalonate-semialdehyde dehydrogenase [unclassified Halomonas]|jgi:malonate-semialdehyde dehydrogenase (acetylating)/methylmalonate-semialdehyde dehydrogenase|uniref:CoA-acylating methylmalonate-semialdehyde dehydrogenase n=1 Tax=unclassified Halomonas TaxID=2609666 RepID=UPI001EF425F6|nr:MULTISPECIES: CoA-acylating methylmalonate-semialdehyde dehydrogenase [unclassified Halomonas]MCG7578473.1 CoA-acylating methylmalonate-semialdehyde dehydrogenase [Halomonas sp. MMH1-48]MCG7605585.1 CoA-acylating methylmalonate-semialdehyde dehydrogenase [Halomonas sp. MM17-34]MCG7614775.1 CoA-acylating methylmalonate-semialdehyde dehydrogenase [Halomonas sp. MM17-29]MCG7621658.1 CoA-acylating methylmalonate-semialdehyde dehydrogenase [Halomonas sp. DSH1-27]
MTTHAIHHFINGQRSEGTSGSAQEVFNPATGQVTGRVALASSADVDTAVQAAQAAFPAWADTPPIRRARVMFKFLELLNANKDALAEAITKEHGKVFTDAQGEVARGIDIVEFACGIPQLLKGDYTEQVSTGIDNWTVRQPLGVVAGITPFNFPAMVPMWMFPIAIAAGNTFILKPSPLDPSASLMIADLLQQAGLPDGVFNVVQGDKDSVEALIDHPDVKALSFVGSTPIANLIYERGAKHGKRVQALGGAKNHMVVMPDAHLDKAVDALIGAAYGSAGERCMAISVAVLVGDVADKVVPMLTERAKALKVKDGMQLDAEMGPIVTRQAHQRITGYIEKGVAEGAELVVDGREFDGAQAGEGCSDGFWMGGTLFDHVTPEMTIYKEEIFGPVLVCVRVPDVATAIQLINGHEFGNGVSCFTESGSVAREFGRRIQVGMVGINVPIPVPMAWHGFGGWKRSLFGDTHAYGEEGVRFYTKQKSIMQRWSDSIDAGAEFVMPTAK